MVVEVPRAQDEKIEQRQGFWPTKLKTDVHGLNFSLVHANDNRCHGAFQQEG